MLIKDVELSPNKFSLYANGERILISYQSRRHRCLMDESEQALSDAVQSAPTLESRIAKQVLADHKTYRLWESRHADLVRPVAEQSRRGPQVLALRSIEARLLHRRALIEHIRERQIFGAVRDKLFHVFYGPKDPIDAIITEHRQYVLAVSSRISADHLINVMHDPVSIHLLEVYESIYREYFELYCFMVTTEDAAIADAVGPVMRDAHKRAKSVRERLNLVEPDNRFSNFDREAALARSGRYPILDYMVG